MYPCNLKQVMQAQVVQEILNDIIKSLPSLKEGYKQGHVRGTVLSASDHLDKRVRSKKLMSLLNSKK